MSWDYTTWLNIVFLLLAAVLVVRFVRTGGRMMLKMMGGAPGQPGEEAGHAHHNLALLGLRHPLRRVRQAGASWPVAGSRA